MQEEIRALFGGAGVEYREEDWEFFERFRALVVEANAVMNLTRLTEPFDFHIKHVLDSLLPFVAIPALRDLGDGLRVADLGSGAGFPGLVLARARPSWRLTLLERTLKKATFLERTARALDLHNVEVVPRDARESGLDHACHLVTARAVGRLAETCRAAAGLLAVDGILANYKGGTVEESELREGEQESKRQKLSQGEPLRYTLPPDMGRSMVLTRRVGRKRRAEY